MEFALTIATKAALLTGSALLLCRVASRAPAALRHAICLAALVGSAAMPVLHAVLPGIEIGLPGIGIGALTSDPSSGAADRAPALATALAGAWLLGAVFFGGRLAASLLATARTVRESSPVRDARLLGLAVDARRELGVRVPLRLAFGDRVPGPAGFGLLGRHTILLPAAARGWSTHRLRAMFLHEIAHVARRDCLTQTVAGIAAALYWFLPPAWWALRRLRVEREVACDDRVISLGARPSGYAAFLVDSFRRLRGGRALPAAAASVGGREELEHRIGAVLSADRRRGALGRLRLVVALAAVALVLPIAAVRGGPARLTPHRSEAGGGGTRVHVHAFATSHAAACSGTVEFGSGRR